MIDQNDLVSIIRNSISAVPKMYSRSAVSLLLGTAAVESGMGSYLTQLGGGPARGVFQMEPATEADIWVNFLRYRDGMRDAVTSVTGVARPCPAHLKGNIIYATVMARIKYYRAPGALPEFDDIAKQGRYWKDHYNTSLGAGKIEDFYKAYPYGVSI